MKKERKEHGAKPQRPDARGTGLKRAIAGCILFGAGVVVGALLWPLAGSKGTQPGPRKVAKPAVSSAKKKGTEMEAKDPSPEKDEKLTFFRTLKEDSSASKHNFVPFKPAQDTPPPLEAVASKEVDEERPEAPRIEPRAEEPAPEAAPKASFHYYVGVAAFQFRDNAHRLTEELKRSGYPAYAVNTKAGTKPHRVRVGPFQSFREANGTAHRIEEVFLYPSSVFKKTRP